jgi:IclR family pca regulon transcriptional regulator
MKPSFKDKSQQMPINGDQGHSAVRAGNSSANLEGNPDFVLSLARGLKVIEAFQGQINGLSAAEIAGETGFSRAAVRRLLMTLELLGYAERTGRVYRLGTRTLTLGFAALSSNPLSVHAQPILESVTSVLHESCSLAVLEGDEMVYIARAFARRVLSMSLSVGSRLPAYCTSVGRVLIAALPDDELRAYLRRVELKALTPKTVMGRAALGRLIERVRVDGFAIMDEELEFGHRSIAVPVKTRHNRTVAALNSGAHAARVSVAQMKRQFLPVLLENAQALGQLLA